MMKNKIIELDELTEIVAKIKNSGKKTILCHGVFDLLHIGHIRYLNSARKLGDVLITTITPDKYVNKGPHKPEFSEKLRAESIASLDVVDYVAINRWPTAVEAIKMLKPDIFAKGVEYKFKNDGRFRNEMNEVEKAGGKVIFTTDQTHSSSKLLNKQNYNVAAIQYLEKYKERYNFNDILKFLNSIQELKVLVVGEVIIEEYCSGYHMGKMRRESLLEFMLNKKEKFIGGTGIIANHLANFTDSVDLLTTIGDRDSQEHFIISKLNSKINKFIFTKKDSPTPVKSRYIEERINYRNLFKVVEMNDHPLDSETSATVLKKLDEILPQYDVVIVADYGHGMIDDAIREKLVSKSKFLAVYTPFNTENKGYNAIDRYSKVDYGCMNEEELRMINRDKFTELDKLCSSFSNRANIVRLAVTMGYYGCATYSQDEGFNETPALSTDAIDPMGAQEAFFAVTSPLAKLSVPIDIIGFIGNVVGGIFIKVKGNQKPVMKNELLPYIERLMK